MLEHSIRLMPECTVNPEAGESIINQINIRIGKLQLEIGENKRLLEDLITLESKSSRKSFLHRILVKVKKHLVLVYCSDICWFEAWGDYIRLHTCGNCYLVRQKICDLEAKLDPLKFLRINRSAIINIDQIKELEPLNHGDYLVTLKNNTQLNLSRNYRSRLSAVFEDNI